MYLGQVAIYLHSSQCYSPFYLKYFLSLSGIYSSPPQFHCGYQYKHFSDLTSLRWTIQALGFLFSGSRFYKPKTDIYVMNF